MAHRWRTKRPTAADAERRKVYTSPEHRRLRATIQAQIDRGTPTYCWRCSKRLAGKAWHLGHDDHDRSLYRGAECIPCNLKAAARKGNATQRARREPRRRRLL